MSALIDRLFIKKDADAIRTLWEDRSTHLLLEQEIGKEILNNDNLILEMPLTQIMFILTLSPFSSGENECHDIAEIIYWGMDKTDIIPMAFEHKGFDLACRCLLSLSFFKGKMKQRTERYGCPSVSFYRKIGIEAFRKIGKVDISRHFCQWEVFLGEVILLV